MTPAFKRGEIAHLGNARRVLGLPGPDALGGDRFTTTLRQEFWIDSAFPGGELGPYYHGYVLHKGTLYYLESVLQTDLIGKKTWALMEPLLEKLPELVPDHDFPAGWQPPTGSERK